MDNSAKVNIRNVKESDSIAISMILKEVGWFKVINEELVAEIEKRILKYIRDFVLEGNQSNNHIVLVAEKNGGVVGYISIHWIPYFFLSAPEGYVSELFVLNSERNQGIGRLLIDEAKRLARARGCGRLMLINGRDRESYKRNFYKDLGWVEREEAKNFIFSL
jgi:GNAT superfamily N-acetyltransferase